MTFSVVQLLRYSGSTFPMFPFSGNICITSRPDSVAGKRKIGDQTTEQQLILLNISFIIYSVMFSSCPGVLHLLPRAQASSLPRKPPPMIVMDLMFLETFSNDLKSSICGGEQNLYQIYFRVVNISIMSYLYHYFHSKNMTLFLICFVLSARNSQTETKLPPPCG